MAILPSRCSSRVDLLEWWHLINFIFEQAVKATYRGKWTILFNMWYQGYFDTTQTQFTCKRERAKPRPLSSHLSLSHPLLFYILYVTMRTLFFSMCVRICFYLSISSPISLYFSIFVSCSLFLPLLSAYVSIFLSFYVFRVSLYRSVVVF